MRWILSAALLFAATAAHAADAPDAFCPGFNQFIEAAAPTPPQRVALFYPMSAGGNAPDQFSPMEAAPHDDAADVFYAKVVGRTQGAQWDRFADELVRCLKARGAFWSSDETRTNGTYRLRVIDHDTFRAVIIESGRHLCPDPLKAQLAGTGGRCVQVTVRGK